MNRIRTTYSLMLIALGIFCIGFYMAMNMSETIANLLPGKVGITHQIYGVSCNIFMVIGGIYLLKGRKVSIVALIISAVLFSMAGISSLLFEHGVFAFGLVSADSYTAIAVRVVLVVIAAFLVRNSLPANKSLKDAP